MTIKWTFEPSSQNQSATTPFWKIVIFQPKCKRKCFGFLPTPQLVAFLCLIKTKFNTSPWLLGNVIVYFWPFFLTFVDKNIINELGKWSKMAVGRSNPGIISYPMCIYVASSSLRVLGLNNLACGVRKNRCVSMYRCCSLRYSRNHPHATYCIYEDQCRHPH